MPAHKPDLAACAVLNGPIAEPAREQSGVEIEGLVSNGGALTEEIETIKRELQE
jgi:hypothetical protein